VKHYKNRLLLTVALIPAFCELQAQDKPSKFFAEISGGPSLPIGQFGEKEYTGFEEKDQPGMAGTGLGANATFGYYVKENVGLLITGGYGSHKQKTEGREWYIKRNFYVSATEVDVDANNWKLWKVMAGGFLVTPIAENKLNLITKASAGICKTAVPEYSWLAYTATGPAFAGGKEGEVKLPATFCYQISLGLQYKLSNRFHLFFDINSFNATATHDVPQQIGIPPGGSAIPDQKYKFGSVNALLGAGVNF
jgi:hypothetical protein